jgi:hypothetical protein
MHRKGSIGETGGIRQKTLSSGHPELKELRAQTGLYKIRQFEKQHLNGLNGMMDLHRTKKTGRNSDGGNVK